MSETAPSPANPAMSGESRHSGEVRAFHDIPPVNLATPAVPLTNGGTTLRPQAQDFHNAGRFAAYQQAPGGHQPHHSNASTFPPMQKDFNVTHSNEARSNQGGWWQKFVGSAKPPHEHFLDDLKQQNERLCWDNGELRRFNVELQQYVRDKENKLWDGSKNLNKKIRDLNAANTKIGQLKHEHQREINSCQMAFQHNQTAQLQSRQKQHDQAIKALRDSAASRETDLKQKQERDLQQIRKKHNEELSKLSDNHKRELQRHQDLHEQKFQTIEHSTESRIKHEMVQEMIPRIPPVNESEHRFTAALESEKAKYDTMKRGYEQKVAELATQVRKMQEAKMRSVESVRWAALSHSNIERCLGSILSDIQQWAQKHTSITIEHVTGFKIFARICNYLIDEGCIQSPDLLRDHLMDDPKMQKRGKAAAFLLTAVASSVLNNRIVANPFFAFVGSDSDKLLRKQEGVTLRRVLNHLQSAGDKAAVHALRCQVLRFFDPIDAHTADTAQMNEVASRSRSASGKKNAAIVMNGIAHLLVPKDKLAVARPELEVIANKLAELSWQLWTRKPVLEVWRQAELGKQAPVDNETEPLFYSSKDDRLQHHALHNGDVADEEDALDGREVVLISSPAVVAFGNADGEDYDKRKVLRKAVVWLGASSASSAPKKAEEKVEPGASRVYPQHYKNAVLGLKSPAC